MVSTCVFRSDGGRPDDHPQLDDDVAAGELFRLGGSAHPPDQPDLVDPDAAGVLVGDRLCHCLFPRHVPTQGRPRPTHQRVPLACGRWDDPRTPCGRRSRTRDGSDRCGSVVPRNSGVSARTRPRGRRRVTVPRTSPAGVTVSSVDGAPAPMAATAVTSPDTSASRESTTTTQPSGWRPTTASTGTCGCRPGSMARAESRSAMPTSSRRPPHHDHHRRHGRRRDPRYPGCARRTSCA